jgi:pimeloyl-ACP methyl ester carboxylesterase
VTGLLLVHGAWHGAWCWEPLQQRLTSREIRSVAIDLPGHGDRRRPAWRVSWRDYVEAVCDAAGAFSTPPILVGHSMGGGVITGAAALAPDAFAAMVYVAAFVPRPGDSILSLAKQDRPIDGGRIDLLRGQITFTPQRAAEIFFHDCPDPDRWSGLIQPQPIRPTLAKMPDRQVTIPRHYIRCKQDRAISSEHQRRMAENAGIDQLYEMDCGHSPFLAAPDRLADILADIQMSVP